MLEPCQLSERLQSLKLRVEEYVTRLTIAARIHDTLTVEEASNGLRRLWPVWHEVQKGVVELEERTYNMDAILSLTKEADE